MNRASDSGAIKRSLDKREAPFLKGLPTLGFLGISDSHLFFCRRIRDQHKANCTFSAGGRYPQIFHCDANPPPPVAQKQHITLGLTLSVLTLCCIYATHHTMTNPNRVNEHRVNPDRVDAKRVNPDGGNGWKRMETDESLLFHR